MIEDPTARSFLDPAMQVGRAEQMPVAMPMVPVPVFIALALRIMIKSHFYTSRKGTAPHKCKKQEWPFPTFSDIDFAPSALLTLRHRQLYWLPHTATIHYIISGVLGAWGLGTGNEKVY